MTARAGLQVENIHKRFTAIPNGWFVAAVLMDAGAERFESFVTDVLLSCHLGQGVIFH